jgi:UPF0176 protein
MYQVLLFYKYVTVSDPEALAERFRAFMQKYKLTGRVIIAEEGVNATLEGLYEHTEAFVKELFEDARLADIAVKRSVGTGESFRKLSVKVRDEIVGTRFEKSVDPRVKTAPRLSPDELRAWYRQNKDFVIVDMRNDYEYQSGHFKNSVNPELENSRDLPLALPKLEPLKDKKVVTVCTGGVRCEKMSAYLLAKGFSDVYQLEDGIHSYMEQYPGQDFLGTLYTFDNRLVMDFGGEREIIGACRLCNTKTEQYVNCANNACHRHYLLCGSCQKNGKLACGEACEHFLQTQTFQKSSELRAREGAISAGL